MDQDFFFFFPSNLASITKLFKIYIRGFSLQRPELKVFRVFQSTGSLCFEKDPQIIWLVTSSSSTLSGHTEVGIQRLAENQ